MEKNRCNNECNHQYACNRPCCSKPECCYERCSNNPNCCPCKKKEKITLEAWAGRCGSIFPCGYVKVPKGNDITFLIKAENGYRIQDIMVDCERITDDYVVIEKQDRYALTFCRVSCSHRVDAYFVKK